MLFAASGTTLSRAYVYQTGIMEAHCVLSTADSLSYCVNRPSCVRPAALQRSNKARGVAHTPHRAALRRRGSRRSEFLRNIRAEHKKHFSSLTAAVYLSARIRLAVQDHPRLSLPAGRHGNARFIPQRKCLASAERHDRVRSLPRPQKGS